MKLIYVLITFVLLAVATTAVTPAMATPSIATYYIWGGGTNSFPVVTASNQWVVLAATGTGATAPPTPFVNNTAAHTTTNFTLINSLANGTYDNISIWAAQVTIDSTHTLSLSNSYVWDIDVCSGVSSVKSATGTASGVGFGGPVSYTITVPSGGPYYPLAYVGLFNLGGSLPPTIGTGYNPAGLANDGSVVWTDGGISTSSTSTSLPFSFSVPTADYAAWVSCACVLK